MNIKNKDLILQWLIDIILEVVAGLGYLIAALVDRGDPGTPDWERDDLTRDNTWHDLDCSAIVPEGATGVLLRVGYKAAFLTHQIQFKTKGNVGWPNVVYCLVVVSNASHHKDATVAVDSNRFAQYRVSHVSGWAHIQITIAGWYY